MASRIQLSLMSGSMFEMTEPIMISNISDPPPRRPRAPLANFTYHSHIKILVKSTSKTCDVEQGTTDNGMTITAMRTSCQIPSRKYRGYPQTTVIRFVSFSEKCFKMRLMATLTSFVSK